MLHASRQLTREKNDKLLDRCENSTLKELSKTTCMCDIIATYGDVTDTFTNRVSSWSSHLLKISLVTLQMRFQPGNTFKSMKLPVSICQPFFLVLSLLMVSTPPWEAHQVLCLLSNKIIYLCSHCNHLTENPSLVIIRNIMGNRYNLYLIL